MSIELKIPEVGESIVEVQIGRWLHAEGDFVEADEDLVELETDKASVEVPAPKAGVLTKILKKEGEIVNVGETVAHIDTEAKAGAPSKAPAPKSDANGKEPADEKPAPAKPAPKKPEPAKPAAKKKDSPKPAPAKPAPATPTPTAKAAQDSGILATPSARRALREHGLTADDIEVDGTRIRHEDVIQSVAKREEADAPANPAPTQLVPKPAPNPTSSLSAVSSDSAEERLVPMSLIRRRIAARLLDAQHSAALLTTFNEIDVSAVKELRKTHGERFRDKHGIKLGFMSFFVKAAVDALRQTPELNAEIRDDHIAYRNYYHIGVAIGSEKGLVVPVLRHAERMSFADIELAISDFATRANSNKITPSDLVDGTFTITNGGVYGSLLSTPIVNPPQSGVLGMHSIQERPVAVNGQVVIRPMMYVALTYDHRIVDGKEAVTFLRRIKEAVEEPSRMLIEA